MRSFNLRVVVVEREADARDFRRNNPLVMSRMHSSAVPNLMESKRDNTLEEIAGYLLKRALKRDNPMNQW